MTAYQTPEAFPRLPLAGYPVAALTTPELIAQLIRDLDKGRTRMLFFVNT